MVLFDFVILGISVFCEGVCCLRFGLFMIVVGPFCFRFLYVVCYFFGFGHYSFDIDVVDFMLFGVFVCR